MVAIADIYNNIIIIEVSDSEKRSGLFSVSLIIDGKTIDTDYINTNRGPYKISLEGEYLDFKSSVEVMASLPEYIPGGNKEIDFFWKGEWCRKNSDGRWHCYNRNNLVDFYSHEYRL